jgi:GT2 family glycosyltransferase
VKGTAVEAESYDNPTKDKVLYTERLQHVLRIFMRTDWSRYEQITNDDASCSVIKDTLNRMIQTIEESDDEACLRPFHNFAERHYLEQFGI